MSDGRQGSASFATVAGLRVEIAQGDIAAQTDLDVIVNAANAFLAPGAGVAGAIHAAAGPGLAEECRPLAPIAVGECAITSGQRLANPFVIHCLGPIYATDDDPSGHLASCFRRALEIADARGLRSIGFPAISTGVFGYPREEAAAVTMRAIAECASSLEHVRLVRIVLFDSASCSVFVSALRAVVDDGSSNVG